MRNAGRVRLGFFPCPPDAVEMTAARLRPPITGSWSILDPCAGEGAAIKQLSEMLHARPADVHAIELDQARAEMVKAALPQGKVLAPASTFGCSASLQKFSLIWCNAPFDAVLGGGSRTEKDFLTVSTDWLMPSGILCLVCPEHVSESWDVRSHLEQWYSQVSVLKFPDHCREYGEVVVMAVRRKEPIAYATSVSWSDLAAPAGYVYQIPKSDGPRMFKKTEPTELEMQRMLAASPLRRHLTNKPESPLPSPPLSLSTGHVALLLASGQLDGVVCPQGEQPHVVRGTAKKIDKVVSCETTEDEKGRETTKTVTREQITLVVRVVDASGTIHTFAQEEK
jgi:hypothetical protein